MGPKSVLDTSTLGVRLENQMPVVRDKEFQGKYYFGSFLPTSLFTHFDSFAFPDFKWEELT